MKTENHISNKTYVLVWIALLALTTLTVLAFGVDLGGLNILVSMSIASIKVLLVLIYFMHLRHEKGFLIGAILIVLIIILVVTGLTFTDISYRRMDTNVF